MSKVAVITGAGAGVGRAVAEKFASKGFSVALLSRNEARLEDTSSALMEKYAVQTLVIPVDVANGKQVDDAASRIEHELGPIDVWINVAMATVFSPVSGLEPAEVERATQVTYLGQVYGMMAALRHMRLRNRGTIINVGSALAHRSVPLQAAYCGSKAAIRGFTDSLRSELIHDRLNIKLTIVDLPAVNTPQFDWARNKIHRKARPVAPVFQPDVAARAVWFAATHDRREVWVGFSTVKAILANRIAPRLADRYLAHAGYSGQITNQRLAPDAPDNLFESPDGNWQAEGRFDDEAKSINWQMFTERHRNMLWAVTALGVVGLLWRKIK